MKEEQVILVDVHDNMVGTMEKLMAHQSGYLHRAFSIFIFNDHDELLLQRRAHDKYHSGGLWTNTCCSHPRPEESIEEATHRRLMEEMGFDCELMNAFSFVYKADCSNGLIEHELDHVYIGRYDLKPQTNPTEVAEWKYMSIPSIQKDLSKNPSVYTQWFKIAFNKVVDHI